MAVNLHVAVATITLKPEPTNPKCGKTKDEVIVVKFEVNGKTYSGSAEDAIQIVDGLVATSDKAALCFKNIVIARAVTALNSSNSSKFVVGNALWMCDGSFSLDRFRILLNSDPSISNDDWLSYLGRC